MIVHYGASGSERKRLAETVAKEIYGIDNYTLNGKQEKAKE